jgi:hypothetical protein
MEGLSPSRWLAYRALGLESIDERIVVDSDGTWKSRLQSALGTAKRIRLLYERPRSAEVASEVSTLLAKEHDRGYLFSPFVVTGAERKGEQWEMLLQPGSDLRA